MPEPNDPERFRLTLRALPSETPVEIRLRGILKRLLRTWGFRAELVEQLPAGEGKQAVGGQVQAPEG